MEASKQTIFVTGATGRQGGAVAYSLLTRGSRVLALVRDTNTPAAQALKEAGASLVVGDLNDRASLDRSLSGVGGVFSVQGLQDGMEAEIRQGSVLADAAKAAGVQHFVYSSVGSAERSTGIPHFNSKFQIEAHIRQIGLPYTILRPVFFYYNYEGMRPFIETGMFALPLSPNRKLQQLSERDYGKMTAEVFACRDVFLGRAIEAASVNMTMTEVAAAFSRALGRSVTYRQISYELFEQQAGKESATMFRWFENVGYSADLAALKREFGEPTTLESCLRERGWTGSKPSSAGQDNATQSSGKGNNAMTDTAMTDTAMTDTATPASEVYPPIPPDNLERTLVLAQPDKDPNLPHIGVVGDTYTILLTGEDTAGQYCLIDMLVPPGGGPPPHRHNFEESFVVLEGEIEATFRGRKMTVRTGDTINIPANAPHQFTNATSAPARLLCTCSPSGQEWFFMEVGIKVETRTTAPPKLDAAGMARMQAKMKALSPKFKTEQLDHA